ncbi:MAG TPA: DNA polymerase Y family protein [Acidimicrobiales bacterium]|nr:DNA polymerase Y family protein [Acidimicrobiales bacterium]
MAGVRTLVVRCPDWPVVAAGYPAAVPVAVVFANRLVACSAAAREDGVAVGLRRREAQGRCPELVVVEQDVGRDARAFEPVAAAVEAFTPRVEVGRPGVVSFETRGPSRYFGGDRALAAKVAAVVDGRLAAMGAAGCQVGVADGPFAAAQAAATAAPGPTGARVVPPGASATFLSPFPTTVLERPEFTDLLNRLGLPTLGDLAALPAATVLARFGADGAAAHRLARGLDERPLAVRDPPPDLAVAAELDPPAERVDMAMFVAKALADQLHASLAARGLACTRIAIEAETEHGERRVRLWRHDGSLSARAIAERVRWQLDGWLSAGETTAGVSLIRLLPDEVKPDHGRQLGFWGGSAAAGDRAARGLARIQGLLGPEAVVTAVVGGGRDPAGQVRLIPWGDPRPAVTAGGPWPGHLPLPAPALVYPEPLPAVVRDREGRVVAVSGRGMLDEMPATLAIGRAAPVPVTAWAGPWPAEERWWDAPRRRRRARFQVGLTDGSAHVVVLENGRWGVEATYD